MMMKAAVSRTFGKKLEIQQIEIPEVGIGEVLVKIFVSGVCHTDLHAIEGSWPVKPNLPFIPGHEGVGEIVALGIGVTHLKNGDRVGISWVNSACGHCEYCLNAWETLCVFQKNSGYSVNGSFAEYVLADANYVSILPDNVNYYEIAPILCAGVTVYKGLKMTNTQPGNWIIISGIGGLGHLAVQYAKIMGLNIAAIDIDDKKLALAKRLGATITVNSRKNDPVSFLKKQIGGAHGILITAVSKKAFEQSISMIRRGGTIVFNGLPPGKFNLSIFDIVFNGITICGSIVGTRKDLQESLNFVSQEKIKANVHIESLDHINIVLDDMRTGSIEGRMIIDMSL